MTVLRFLAGLFLLAAIIAFVSDATRPLMGTGRFVPTSLARLWTETAPKSLVAVRNVVSQGLSPAVWDSVVASILRLPTFLFLGILGILLGYLGRRRSRIDVYTN